MSSSDSAHEFGALNTLLLVVILGLCIIAAYLIKQNSFYYLPESAAAIVVGMVVGGLARLVYPSAEELNFLTFEPELFFFLLLPPIIFEAGYSLKKKDFFANFWTISLYAVFGTIISTFFIGYLVYWTALTGIINIDSSSPMEGLVFGSLISAVDPVATLSIMGNPELNCDTLLYSLVFGESVLNDAVAIVLFKTFTQFYESGAQFSGQTVLTILLNFSIVSLGSVFIGIATGLCCSYLCKHTSLKNYPEYEISILFLFAYGSYSFSEALNFSGIMSLFFCGIFLSHYNSYNLSPTSQITAHNIFKSLAVLSEYFVFLYIGMGLFTGKLIKQVNFLFFFLCMVYCLLARMLNIFPLSILANLCRRQKIPIKMQVVMWFAGLRGAIAFALSQNMPKEHRNIYVSTTLLIVIFTTVICGGMTEPILTHMGMRTGKIDEVNRDGSTTSQEKQIDSAGSKLFNRYSSRTSTNSSTEHFEVSKSFLLSYLAFNCILRSMTILKALIEIHFKGFRPQVVQKVYRQAVVFHFCNGLTNNL
jgi:solute carrier family 9 (sodium/hydrogen exchanger), member 8